MKTWIIAIIACAAFAAVPSTTVCQGQAAPSPNTLTLDQAIKIALENNRTVKNARFEIDKADAQLDAMRTRRLPSLKFNSLIAKPLSTFDTNFDKGVFGTFPATGPIPAEDTQITSSTEPTALVLTQVAQPLTQLRKIGLQIRQLKLEKEISLAEANRTEQAIVNDVKRAYYSVLQTQSATEAAAETVKLYREIDRLTGEYVIQQAALKTDLLDVQSRLAKAEYDVLTLGNSLASQKEQLNNLLGRDVRTEFSVSDGLEAAQLEMRETDLAQARNRALEQRPEISEAKLRLQQTKLDKQIKKTDYLPEVSLTFNYASTFNYSDFVPRNITAFGVQVEWEVFDWGRRKRELTEKQVAVSQADNALLDAESKVLMEVNDRFRKLQETVQLIRLAKTAQTAARANLQLASYKYRVEAVLFRDVLSAQSTLANADYDYRKAVLSFWTAKADFEKAIGENK